MNLNDTRTVGVVLKAPMLLNLMFDHEAFPHILYCIVMTLWAVVDMDYITGLLDA
jgi:hypothetical protein